MDFGNGIYKAVTFSYDDGVTQDIRMIELMNQYGIKSTFNLNSELLGKNRMLPCKGHRISHYKVHPSDVREIYAGHEIAVHTLTHPRLTELDEQEIVRQVEEDRLRLSELAGYEVIGMAYPCGGVNNDDRVAEIIKKNTGVKYSRTITCSGSFEPQENLYRFDPTVCHLHFDEMMELAEKFIAMDARSPRIFYVWGHSYEMDLASDYWMRLEELFKLISGRKDIFYGTNREIFGF
ncbi:MAG: polysaccharide deacetylase family protein [Clostridia bacterium]|nr:polysaccharide deacetylase family protein [Clostridia bacterium]